MIANAIKQAYSTTAPTHLGAGISIPRKSTKRVLSRCALFLSPVVYDRLCRGDSSRRSLSGNANSVQSVTLLISINGGSSLNWKEATTMSNHIYDIPLHLSAQQMDAFSILLLNLLEADISDFTNGNDLLAMHAKKASMETINAMSVFGGVQ